MRIKSTSTKNAVLVIILFTCFGFSAQNVNLVSPYIINGFSQTYSVSLKPKKFIGVYEADSAIGEYEVLQSYELFETQMFNIFGIRERFEIGFGGLVYISNDLFSRLRLRTVFKLYERGNDNLFQNITITPFAGISTANINFLNSLINSAAVMGNELWLRYTNRYIGLSIGTKKQEKEGNTFELFSSFSYSFTKYCLDNDFGSLSDDFVYRDFENLLKREISIPVGFRKVYFANTKIISIKSGIGLNFAFPNSNMDFKDSQIIDYAKKHNKDLFYKISYFSAFAEFGFHFGVRKIRKQEEQKEVLL